MLEMNACARAFLDGKSLTDPGLFGFIKRSEVAVESSNSRVRVYTDGAAHSEVLSIRKFSGDSQWAKDLLLRVDKASASAFSSSQPVEPQAFDFAAMLDIVNEKVAIRPIPLPELKEVSSRMGYSLPGFGEIVAANGIVHESAAKQLDLKVNHGGTTFEISQYRPTISKSSFPADWAKPLREIGGVSVTVVFDPGTRHNLTYVWAPDVTYVANGDIGGNQDFRRIIESFRVLPRHPERRQE